MPSRRHFLRTSAAACAAALTGPAFGEEKPGEGGGAAVEVLHPRGRVPLSLIVDDSTCLVNLGRFSLPQFGAVMPDNPEYHRPWRDWPAEIPDSFVRKFNDWCADHGVRGKYSVVPYPACVGWIDRCMPGWSRTQLADSVRLVREEMTPHWDVHPEMISHTWVIDLGTGRPVAGTGRGDCELFYPQTDVGSDRLAEYVAYALRLLKEVGLPCEGVTTPGGFGNRFPEQTALGIRQALADVFAPEIPHYFSDLREGDEDTEPTFEAAGGDDFLVNVPAGANDFLGGWHGSDDPDGFKYSNADATAGRMVELIESGRPAVIVAHWPGFYCNGRETGLRHFQDAVLALAGRFGDRTQWMKVSEIARHAAARRFTTVAAAADGWTLQARHACPQFTLRLPGTAAALSLDHGGDRLPLTPVGLAKHLDAGRRHDTDAGTVVCFDLPEGRSLLRRD